MQNLLLINPYVEMFSVIVILSLSFYVIARNPDDRLSRAFSFFSSIMGIAAFFEVCFRITPFSEKWLLWFFHRTATSLWSFGFAAFLLFGLVYAKKFKFLHNPLTYIIIFIPSVGISYIYLFTDIAVRGYYHLPHGNVSLATPALLIFVLHAWFFLFSSLAFILNRSLKSKNPILIKRGLIICFAALIPTIAGVIVDGILPAMGIRYPSQAINTVAIFCFITYFAMRRYSLFSIEPAQAVGAILQTTYSSIIALDMESKISFVNPSACKLLGYNPEDLYEKDTAEFFNKSTYNLISVDLLEKNKPINALVTQVYTRSGEKRWVKINGVILNDPLGSKIGAILDFEDITERKKAEDVLKKHTEELEKINTFMMGREIEMIELKKEINSLLKKDGMPEKYEI